MNDKQLLNQAIEKWYAVAYQGNIDRGTRDCALCSKYSEKNCKDCPIARKTGKEACCGTPYIQWINYHYAIYEPTSRTFKVFDDHSQKLAVDELMFLTEIYEEI